MPQTERWSRRPVPAVLCLRHSQQGGSAASLRRCAVLWGLVLLSALALQACAQGGAPGLPPLSVTAGHTPLPPTSVPRTTGTPAGPPAHYLAHLLLDGRYRPDDLVFDPAGRLLFSDVHHGTVSRLNANGSVTRLISGLAGPEGLVFLPDGTLVIAEQNTNRILAFSLRSGSLSVLRVLPGVPSGQPCKAGVDGIAFDPTTGTLIVPDSPLGTVYRLSLDGKQLTQLAAHIPRPVGAAVDARGNIYIADECGGALWEIGAGASLTRMGGFGMLDDVAFDRQGNILVTDLKPAIHALVRIRLPGGQRDVLASQGLVEPQGLAVDSRGRIFVADDAAARLVMYIPAPGP
jgi:sugar lactone lactonase YvrE